MQKIEVYSNVRRFLSQPVPRPRRFLRNTLDAYELGVRQGRAEGVEFALLEGVDWGLDMGMDMAFSLGENAALPAKIANA